MNSDQAKRLKKSQKNQRAQFGYTSAFPKVTKRTDNQVNIVIWIYSK